MKVVILAGGIGTRFGQETDLIPKPMVTVGDRPILWHIMKIFAHFGFTDFIICLGYKGDVIKRYFYDYEILNNDFTIQLGENRRIQLHHSHEERDWKVTLAYTGEKTLKGGRVKKIEKYIDDEAFMLTYGDGVANINLNKLLEFHKNHKKIGTVTGVRPPSRFGELVVEDSRAILLKEKPQAGAGMINGGFFVFNRRIFDYLTDNDNCDFEIGPLEKLSEDGEFMVFPHEGDWACLDTVRDRDHLNTYWETNQAFWKIWE